MNTKKQKKQFSIFDQLKNNTLLYDSDLLPVLVDINSFLRNKPINPAEEQNKTVKVNEGGNMVYTYISHSEDLPVLEVLGHIIKLDHKVMHIYDEVDPSGDVKIVFTDNETKATLYNLFYDDDNDRYDYLYHVTFTLSLSDTPYNEATKRSPNKGIVSNTLIITANYWHNNKLDYAILLDHRRYSAGNRNKSVIWKKSKNKNSIMWQEIYNTTRDKYITKFFTDKYLLGLDTTLENCLDYDYCELTTDKKQVTNKKARKKSTVEKEKTTINYFDTNIATIEQYANIENIFNDGGMIYVYGGGNLLGKILDNDNGALLVEFSQKLENGDNDTPILTSFDLAVMVGNDKRVTCTIVDSKTDYHAVVSQENGNKPVTSKKHNTHGSKGYVLHEYRQKSDKF